MLLTDNSEILNNITDNTAWLKTTPINDEHVRIADSIGIIAGQTSNYVPGITSPTFIVPIGGGEFILFQYRSQPKVFNTDGHVTETINIEAADPRHNENSVYGVSSADFNTETERLCVAMYNYQIVRVFKRNEDKSWTKEFDVGTGSLSYNGFIDTGKLSYPKSVQWLSNGNIAISNYRGKYESDDYNYGYIMEVSGVDGTPVKALMKAEDRYTTSATGSNGIRNPYDMIIDPLNREEMYVVSYGEHKILKVSTETGNTIREYNLPPDVGYLYITAIGLINNGKTLLRTNNKRELIAFSTETGEIEWIKSTTNKDFSYENSGSYNFANFVDLDEERFIMVDYGARTLSFEIDMNEILIQYRPAVNSTEDLELILSKYDFVNIWGAVGEVNLRAFNTMIKIKDIKHVKEVLVELVKKTI